MARRTAPEPSPAPFDLLAQYDLQEELGRGERARVYRARDRVLDHVVAVKLLHDRYGRDGAFAARLYLIARAAAGLGHPNIVAVYDHGPHDGTSFITMEAIVGLDLAELLAKGGPLAPKYALPIVARVLDALAAAHAHGIAHGDLHPRNVILRADTTDGVVVTDFGMGLARDRAARPAAADRDAPYRAPELLPGEPATIAGDIYAVGAILHELLTGAVPTAEALQRRPQAIGRPLFATIRQALAPDPAARLASAPALRDALAEGGVPLPEPWVAAPMGPLEAAVRLPAPGPPRPRGAYRAAVVVVAGALAIGGLAGAAALVQSNRTLAEPTVAAVETPDPLTVAPVEPTPQGVGLAAPTAAPAPTPTATPAVPPTPAPTPTLSPAAAALAPGQGAAVAAGLVQAPTPSVPPRPAATPGTPRVVATAGGTGGAVGVALENFSPYLLQGAYQPLDGRRRDGASVTLYGAGSGYNTGLLNFEVGLLPSGQYALVLGGLDDELTQHATIQIILNGTTVYTGPTTLANRPDPAIDPADLPWDTMRIALPDSSLRVGPNTLVIRNTAPGGDLAAPYVVINNLDIVIGE